MVKQIWQNRDLQILFVLVIGFYLITSTTPPVIGTNQTNTTTPPPVGGGGGGGGGNAPNFQPAPTPENPNPAPIYVGPPAIIHKPIPTSSTTFINCPLPNLDARIKK